MWLPPHQSNLVGATHEPPRTFYGLAKTPTLLYDCPRIFLVPHITSEESDLPSKYGHIKTIPVTLSYVFQTIQYTQKITKT